MIAFGPGECVRLTGVRTSGLVGWLAVRASAEIHFFWISHPFTADSGENQGRHDFAGCGITKIFIAALRRIDGKF